MKTVCKICGNEQEVPKDRQPHIALRCMECGHVIIKGSGKLNRLM